MNSSFYTKSCPHKKSYVEVIDLADLSTLHGIKHSPDVFFVQAFDDTLHLQIELTKAHSLSRNGIAHTHAIIKDTKIHHGLNVCEMILTAMSKCSKKLSLRGWEPFDKHVY